MGVSLKVSNTTGGFLETHDLCHNDWKDEGIKLWKVCS